MSYRHKNNKLFYYIKNYLRQYIPSLIYRRQLIKKTQLRGNFDCEYIRNRVDYYNRLIEVKPLIESRSVALSDFHIGKKCKVHFFDTYEFTRYFSAKLRIVPLFGDIIHIPDIPSIVKSRPIDGDNANSVIMKLGKIRHFLFLKDPYRFEEKQNMLVGRNKARQEHRIRFLERYINSPLCNIGQVNRDINPHFIRKRLTIDEHLRYKFILCLEGNDVASNLKWVMSSNSLAVMPKPKYETWFMEGTLIPDFHYVLIKDDYSDLESRLKYYIEHTDEALKIIENAHQYIDQFRDKEQEDLISLFVLKKYFEKTGQATL
jgi:hypothetical protein